MLHSTSGLSVPNSLYGLERSKRLGFHDLDPFRGRAGGAIILVETSTKAAGRDHHILVGKIGGTVESKIEVMCLETARSLVVADESLPLGLLEGAQ